MPFDKDKAKIGELVWVGGDNRRYIDISSNGKLIITEGDLGGIAVWRISEVKLLPLVWIEEKPVYIGSVLFLKPPRKSSKPFTITRFSSQGRLILFGDTLESCYPIELTWGPSPKKKGKEKVWVNVYRETCQSSKKIADEVAAKAKLDGHFRLACIQVEVEVGATDTFNGVDQK